MFQCHILRETDYWVGKHFFHSSGDKTCIDMTVEGQQGSPHIGSHETYVRVCQPASEPNGLSSLWFGLGGEGW